MLNLESSFQPLLASSAPGGIAVAVVRGDATETAFLGQIDTNTAANADEDTLFEIGSITKTFTALALADMAITGKVQLTDRVGDHVTELVHSPIGGVTLARLASHCAGLPRDPGSVRWEEGDLSYVAMSGYTVRHLLAELLQVNIEPDVNEASYSNLGFALLGHVLSVVDKRPYAELIARRVFEPLGLEDTSIMGPGGPATSAAIGHDESGTPVPPWPLEAFAPAGGIATSPREMLRYAQAALRPEDTPLADAFKLTTERRARLVPGEPPDRDLGVGLGWIVEVRAGRPTLWHTGGTHGFGSMLALDPGRGVAVVALVNSAYTEGLEPAVLQLLDVLAEGQASLRRRGRIDESLIRSPRRHPAMAEKKKPASKNTATAAKRTAASTTGSFTAEERAAMKARAAEVKAEARAKTDRSAGEKDCKAALDKLKGADKAIGKKIHGLVTGAAPDLWPKTWYGMPAYAKDGKVVCFFQAADKFKARYSTLGFSDEANLDQGAMWPTSYALNKLTAADEKKIFALVKKAVR